MEKYINYYNDIKVTLVKTKKFKTITFKVAFLNEFNKENATLYSLLIRVLNNTTKLYNTKNKMINNLFSLYDAEMGVKNSPVYKMSVVTFTFDIVNQKFLRKKDLLEKGLDFLKQVILHPNVTDEAFDENIVLEEKRILAEAIKRIFNNKLRYALRKAIELSCEGSDDILNVSASGTIEELEKITAKDLYLFYKELIAKSQILIYAVGDFEYDYIFELLKNYLPLHSHQRKIDAVAKQKFAITKVKEGQEIQSLNQSKLVMVYRTDLNSISELYYAFCVFNTMLGGLYASDLFQKIREERSLAYSISSQTLIDNQVLVVAAGIDGSEYHLVTDLIIKQIEKYKNGEIDEQLLATAKENIVSEYNEIRDFPHSYCGYMLKMDIIGAEDNITKMINIVKNVTVSDVQEAAKLIYLDTIFLLTDKEENGK